MSKYAVESLYYDTKIQRAVAEPRAQQLGDDTDVWLSRARNNAIDAAVKRKPLPNPEDEKALRRRIAEHDLEAIIAEFPIAKSAIPDTIARGLSFKDTRQYEKAVQVLLRRDEQLREYARGCVFDGSSPPVWD